ncbi:MAG TPA: hemerythrin domain-containing protein [Burkholderiales bacterium]|nr:hemerythrin domain-containing protein [Burkholderiales bacterium]
MTGRIDFYTKVHKGLRASLFRLSQRAASIDYADSQALAGLAAELDGVLRRLSAHAGHEERFIHPLLAEKLGDTAFDREHAELESAQRALQDRLDAIARARTEERRPFGLTFYRALNVFVAKYLEHIDREEQTLPALWERCTDEELRAVLARFGASRPVEEALADIGWMLPALSAPEQAELIGGLSAALSTRR